MKRILHVIDHLNLGGAQSVLVDLVTLMDRSRWHCEVATMHGYGLFATILEEQGIRVHSLSPTVWPPSYLPAFIKLQKHFDLIHFHLSGANWLAKPLAAIGGGQPCIAHDHASSDLRFRGIGATFVDAVMHRFSSHTIAITPDVKNFLLHYEALAPESVTVIPNGINTTQFRPFTTREKEEARLFFGLPVEGRIIGTAGRLAPEKNQAMFLRAAAQTLEQGEKALFVIAGTGPEEKALYDLAQQLGLGDNVCFLGQVQNRVLLYRALNLFVLTSDFEGLPMVLLEAMASGVPVISTNLEGIEYALEGGKHGTLIPPGDIHALSSFFLNASQEKQDQLAKSACSRIEKDFNARKAVIEVERLYQSLL